MIAWRLLIKDFDQQRLNSSADWSAVKGGQVLPHFQQIVSEASTPSCPIAAVFLFLSAAKRGQVLPHFQQIVSGA